MSRVIFPSAIVAIEMIDAVFVLFGILLPRMRAAVFAKILLGVVMAPKYHRFLPREADFLQEKSVSDSCVVAKPVIFGELFVNMLKAQGKVLRD